MNMERKESNRGVVEVEVVAWEISSICLAAEEEAEEADVGPRKVRKNNVCCCVSAVYSRLAFTHLSVVDDIFFVL